MKNILKNGAILILAIVILFTMLVACDEDNASESSSYQSSSSEQSSTTIDSSETESSTPENGDNVPVEEMEAFISLLKSNYTYTIQNGSTSFSRGLIDDNVVQIFESMYDTKGVYTSVENSKTYSYTYDSSDARWHKREAQSLEFNSLILDKLTSAEWTAYDKDTGAFTGTFDGKTVSAQIIKNGNASKLVITAEGDYEVEIYDIDTTEITMPDLSKIIDHTDTGEEPPVVEPPAVSTNDIYAVENGNYDFDIVLMRDILEAWLKGENQWNADVIAQRTLTSMAETENIVYVSPSTEGIEFGVQYSNNEKKYFRNFTISDPLLTSGIENQTIKTKEEFTTYLNSIAIGKLVIGSMSATIDTTISNEDMKTITTNIFDRVSTVGVQLDGITSAGTPVAELENAKVIKGFKSVASSVSAGAGLGNKSSSTYYYIVEIDGKVELVEMAVAATEHQDLNYYVINNTEGRWLIAICKRISLEQDNKDIWTEQ